MFHKQQYEKVLNGKIGMILPKITTGNIEMMIQGGLTVLQMNSAVLEGWGVL